MVILETPVPFFDDFRRRSKDRIKATAQYVQFVIAVFVVDFLIGKFVFRKR